MLAAAVIGALGVVTGAWIQSGDDPAPPGTTPPPSTTAADPAITVEPDSGSAEDTVQVSGSGFGPDEQVVIQVEADGGASVLAGTPRTDAQGGFAAAPIVIPSQFTSLAPAELTVRAVGETSGRAASTSFQLG